MRSFARRSHEQNRMVTGWPRGRGHALRILRHEDRERGREGGGGGGRFREPRHPGGDGDRTGLDRARVGEAVEAAGYAVSQAGAGQDQLVVEGMHSRHVNSIEQSLREIPGVTDAAVNLATEEASVAYEPDRVSLGDLLAAVERGGARAPAADRGGSRRARVRA